MSQNVLLIWLDNSNINEENSADYQDTITQLRRVVDNINTFSDIDQCIDFLTDINDDEVFMIISGELCQSIVSLVHDVAQLYSIFIFFKNKTNDEQRANQWSKIKGAFSDISLLCEALKQAARQYEQNAIPISFMATGDDMSYKSFDQLSCSFMYTQILKEVLLTIEFNQQHVKEFINYCRAVFAESEGKPVALNKLEKEYDKQTPIWWYTADYFLCPMLNRALRLMEVDIIIKIGFFIDDLHRHIEKLHSEQFNKHHTHDIFTVYRGQGMSKTDFDQLKNTKDGLMVFNNFLSTSKKRDVPLMFAESNLTDPNLVGILFVMTIDPAKSRTPFASIDDAGYYTDQEEEVLFSMHTVFRIDDIKPIGENHRLFQVDLILTSDDDKDLRVLTNRIREEIYSNVEGWARMGILLLKMGQFAKAQEVYETLLKQATYEDEKAPIYQLLGSAKFEQGEYKEAVTLFEKSLEIVKNILPLDNRAQTTAYNNIGAVYHKTGKYSEALSFYEKVLEIQQQSLPRNHLDFATSYNNIGTMYHSKGECSKAVSFYEKALKIQQQSLPSNHPNLAVSYNNIGLVYDNMGEYLKAVLSYEKALKIQQQSLPPNHPDLASSYNNIGLVYHTDGGVFESTFVLRKST